MKTKPEPAPAAPATAGNLTEQFAIEYAKSAVPNMLKAITNIKRFNQVTLLGALATSYLHQAHYLRTLNAGIFAYFPPAIFDTAMVAMLIVMRTHGIARDAKRAAMAVFAGTAILSATVNFAANGSLGLRIIFALVVVLVIGVELVAGRIRPDFAAIDRQAAELLAAANKIKAAAPDTPPDPTTEPATKPADDTPAPPAAPAATAPQPAPNPVLNALPAVTDRETTPDVPARLISAARMITVQHRQTSTEPLTANELAARLNTTPDMARHLLAAVDNPAPARINGNTPALGGAR